MTCNSGIVFIDDWFSPGRAGIIVLIRRKTRAVERAALIRLLDKAGEAGLRRNINLNFEVKDLRFIPNNVGQAFQPASSPDFPVRPRGDWEVAP